MKYFFNTTETIDDGMGFQAFDSLHISWLIILLVTVAINCILYKKLQQTGRKRWRMVTAWLLIADELFKMVILLVAGNYSVSYLPLHLCSINIFIIAIHAYKPNYVLDNFLYTVCIPGALAALLFPTWTSLPLANGMHLHSFTVHILLALYPTVLTVGGDIKPDIKALPKSLGLLILMAIPIYGLNLLLGTNFMFLISADPGNPLYWFEENWGMHLLGFPVIIVGILFVMYGPVVLCNKLRNKQKKNET